MNNKNTNLHILLADDDADDRFMFQEAFDELNINAQLHTVQDGKELMEYLTSENNPIPNIIFLDLSMPHKSGLECIIEIKNNFSLKNIPLAIYSASIFENDLENVFTKGANVFIQKPNGYQNLKKTLSYLLHLDWQHHNNTLKRDNFILKI